MNFNDLQNLEQAIDRELKALPELSAPATLSAQVMARIQIKAAPAARHAWTSWSLPARVGSLVAMLALFSGLCFASWWAWRGAGNGPAAQELAGWGSGLGVVLKTAGAILDATLLALRQLGRGFLIAGLVIVVCNYLACVGLGTVAVRFALTRIRRNQSQL